MSTPVSSLAHADEIPWRQLANVEFSARALPVVEAWLAAERIETRLLVALDDELEQRLAQQRARRRRSGASALSAETDLRPLCYLLLMAMERACQSPGSAAIVTRALRLAGLHAVCCLLVSEPIAAPTWSQAHQMFKRAEAAGDVSLVNDLGTSNETLYLRLLLLSTVAGNGMSARQLDKCFDWLESWSRGIVLERVYDAGRHYFAVDLAGEAGLEVIAPDKPLAAARYFDHARLAERVAAGRSDYFRQISIATIGLYASNPLFEYHDALHQLSRYWDYVAVRHSGRDSGRRRIEALQVAAMAGFAQCLGVVEGGIKPEQWTLVDRSPTGAGFKVSGLARAIEKGSLAVFADPQESGWVLGTAVRVSASAQGSDIGVRRLADSWRVVQLQQEAADGAPAGASVVAFFIFGDEARGLADSIILAGDSFDPTQTYTMRPGRDLFRIRLSRVIQSGGDWERVGFDVIKRLKEGA